MKGFFIKVWNGIKKVGSVFRAGSREDAAIKSCIVKIADLLLYGIGAAKFVTSITPTPVDDSIVDQLEYWVTKAKSLGVDTNAAIIAGLKLSIAELKLRNDLIAALNTAKNGIDFAGRILRTVDDIMAISSTDLRTAVQTGYQVEKASIIL